MDSPNDACQVELLVENDFFLDWALYFFMAFCHIEGYYVMIETFIQYLIK